MRTHAEFCESVYDKRNDIEIIGQFSNYKSKIKVRCKKHNFEFDTWATNLLNYERHKYLCPICNKEHTIERNLISHKDFVNRLRLINQNIDVVSDYKGMHKKIHCKCKLDGYEWNVLPTNLIDKKSGCPYCAGNVTVAGKNDIWTTNPEIGELLVNKEDGFKNTINSHKKVEFKCPICGEVSIKSISNVSHQGLSCPICSDGISYPNKFMYNLLKQLKIDFVREYAPKWANRKIYDFYIPSKRIIIEMDGGLGHGHRAYGDFTSVEETKKTDEIKDKLANAHGIDVIRIDCIKSDCNYIKDKILSSKLSNIINFENIDWNSIDIKSRGTLLKDIADLANTTSLTIQDIAKQLKISENTVKKYATIASNHNLSPIPLTDHQLDKKLNARLKYAKEHPNTIFIKTPNGKIYHFEDCEILKDFESDFCETTEVFLNTEDTEKQKELANEMFEQTGILVG